MRAAISQDACASHSSPSASSTVASVTTPMIGCCMENCLHRTRSRHPLARRQTSRCRRPVGGEIAQPSPTRGRLARTLSTCCAIGVGAFALFAGIALTGCGGDDAAAPAPTITSFNEAGDATYTVDQVAELAGLKSTDGNITWETSSGCVVNVILTTPAQIETYAGAGDAVVTNPSGTVGVKFQSEPGCRQALARALESVP